MCHILRTLAGIGEIDEVYAYCSDERICEYLPRGVRFLRRSPGLDRDTTLGREIYDSFTADAEADLYAGARHSPFIRAETVADALRHGGRGYDSAFSAEDPDLRLVRRPAAQLCARTTSPHANHRAGCISETSAFFIFFSAHALVLRPRTPHRGEKPPMAVVDRIEGAGHRQL